MTDIVVGMFRSLDENIKGIGRYPWSSCFQYNRMDQFIGGGS